MNPKKELLQQGLEQLSEKQAEEMDKMLAKRYGFELPVHTDDEVRESMLSELFSGLPYDLDEEKDK